MRNVLTSQLCSLALAAPAQASIVNLELTAKVDSVNIWDYQQDPNFYGTPGQQITVTAVLDSIRTVPEPGTLTMMAAGLSLVTMVRRRNRFNNL